MIYYSRVIVAGTDPVSLEEAKDHLEVTGTSKDAFITALISSATRICEAYAGLSFATAQRKMIMDRFPCGDIILPYGPVQSIDSFKYVDSNGADIDLIADDTYFFNGNSEIAKLQSLTSGSSSNWPVTLNRGGVVTIEYTAGYDDISSDWPLPPQVKQAILQQVGSMFENRQDEIVGSTGTAISKLDQDSRAILDTVKVYWNANY